MSKILFISLISLLLSGCGIFSSSTNKSGNSVNGTNISFEDHLNQKYPNNHIVVSEFGSQILLTGQMLKLEDLFAVKDLTQKIYPNKNIANYLQVNLIEDSKQIKADQYQSKILQEQITNAGFSDKYVKVTTTNQVNYIQNQLEPTKLPQLKEFLNKEKVPNIVFVTNLQESKS